MLKPIIMSYKLTVCQLLILYKYLQILRILLTIIVKCKVQCVLVTELLVSEHNCSKMRTKVYQYQSVSWQLVNKLDSINEKYVYLSFTKMLLSMNRKVATKTSNQHENIDCNELKFFFIQPYPPHTVFYITTNQFWASIN